MNRLRYFITLFPTIAVFTVGISSAAQASGSTDPDGPGLSTALVDSSAEVYGIDSGSESRTAQSHRVQPARRVARMVRTYVPACEGNWPDSPNSLGTLCSRAVEMCAGTTDPSDLGFWVFTASAGVSNRTASSWTATGEFVCRGAGQSDDPAPVEPVVTAEDFRRLPLPAAIIKVQPPNLRTLINIPTNFYAAADPVVIPTTVLGQAVRVRATARRFRWTYGDGKALSTTDPGAPYPELRTAHTYLEPGKRTLGLITTYSGEYSVTGGPWLPIDGVATVNSPSTALTVMAARNELVADPLP